MPDGVVKSGSPMVRLMTSLISASMSKNRRMPDGGMSRTVWLRNSAVARRVGAGWLVIRASLASCRRMAPAALPSALGEVILDATLGAGLGSNVGGTWRPDSDVEHRRRRRSIDAHASDAHE